MVHQIPEKRRSLLHGKQMRICCAPCFFAAIGSAQKTDYACREVKIRQLHTNCRCGLDHRDQTASNGTKARLQWDLCGSGHSSQFEAFGLFLATRLQNKHEIKGHGSTRKSPKGCSPCNKLHNKFPRSLAVDRQLPYRTQPQISKLSTWEGAQSTSF